MSEDFEPTPTNIPLRNFHEEAKAREPRWVGVVAGLLVAGFVAFLCWQLVVEMNYRPANVEPPDGQSLAWPDF